MNRGNQAKTLKQWATRKATIQTNPGDSAPFDWKRWSQKLSVYFYFWV